MLPEQQVPEKATHNDEDGTKARDKSFSYVDRDPVVTHNYLGCSSPDRKARPRSGDISG